MSTMLLTDDVPAFVYPSLLRESHQTEKITLLFEYLLLKTREEAI